MKSLKGFAVFNIVMNIPMAIAMSVTAPLLMGESIINVHTLYMIALGFILATLVNIIFPIQKISQGFAAKFHLEADSVKAKIVGNIPVCALFVVVIGAVMTVVNVPVFPDVIFAFIIPFIPLYIVCFIVSMIFAPIALGAAAKVEA